MRLLDTLVKSLIEYVAEMWRWKGKKGAGSHTEKIHAIGFKIQYKNTKIKRHKSETKLITKAMKFDEKLCKAEEGTRDKECRRLLLEKGKKRAVSGNANNPYPNTIEGWRKGNKYGTNWKASTKT
ncbi:hypothetical protein TSAR_009435 [Trichomalopsis sarcophagae]|uniref:Uncharacterized protein n=1 Tax=Trichomalopsis sarcophagae TaxID=543379 RepID=A0A232EU53_9HYME|nr:hypothetical protein TSAR_009435 [Trichomalopsis sarcophagae]